MAPENLLSRCSPLFVFFFSSLTSITDDFRIRPFYRSGKSASSSYSYFFIRSSFIRVLYTTHEYCQISAARKTSTTNGARSIGGAVRDGPRARQFVILNVVYCDSAAYRSHFTGKSFPNTSSEADLQKFNASALWDHSTSLGNLAADSLKYKVRANSRIVIPVVYSYLRLSFGLDTGSELFRKTNESITAHV